MQRLIVRNAALHSPTGHESRGAVSYRGLSGFLKRLVICAVLLLLLSALAMNAQGQTVVRLPSVGQSMSYQPGEMGGRVVQPFALPGRMDPELVAEREEQVQPILIDDQLPPLNDEILMFDDGTAVAVDKPKTEGKDGFIQEVALIGSWLPQLEGGSLGLTEASVSVTGGLPFPTRNFPLLITPFFQTMFLDGPVTPDLPPRVYSTYLQFRWLPKLSERWRLDVGVAPGMYSDFQVDDGDAFRLTGRGIGIYTWSENLMIAGGVLYLDRPDISILPVGGVIWTPNDDWKLELIFPKPKIARRLSRYQNLFQEEYWVYLSAEFGGDSWAIERADLTTDQFVYRDYRAMLGFQRKVIGGFSTHIEFGYIFNRRVEYTSATPDFEPNDTLMLRLGTVY